MNFFAGFTIKNIRHFGLSSKIYVNNILYAAKFKNSVAKSILDLLIQFKIKKALLPNLNNEMKTQFLYFLHFYYTKKRKKMVKTRFNRIKIVRLLFRTNIKIES